MWFGGVIDKEDKTRTMAVCYDILEWENVFYLVQALHHVVMYWWRWVSSRCSTASRFVSN